MAEVFLGSHNIISPLGFSSEENLSAILKGKTAVVQRQFSFSEKPFMCSQISQTDLNKALGKNTGSFTKLETMCLLSIGDVLQQSGLSLQQKDTLLILSTTKGNIDELESGRLDGREYLSNFSAAIAKHFNAANRPVLVSNACISGLLAIIIAKRYIDAGMYKHVVVCGADLVTEFTLAGFKSFNALSESPCKPFDADRTGINLGEAAATLLLSAEIKSDIVIRAGASANDANHISGPSRNGDGLLQALEPVIKGKKAPDFICAHGTATPYNDEMESVAFFRAGIHELPVHSLKGYYGHTLGAAGVLETVVATECLQGNILLRSAGYSKKGTTHLEHVISETISKKMNACLKTASGFGGCNAAAYFEKLA